MSDGSKPITPPKSNSRRALGRAATEGIVELIPGASLLTNIFAVTHPPAEEVDRTRWEHEMTRRSNEHDELLKRVVSAFLRTKINLERANDAQQLSFVRGGMITTLEGIAREGLTLELQSELRQQLETTAGDVEELLLGLDAALVRMSDDEKNRDFMDTLRDVVFGAFGKSRIREDIERLLHSGKSPRETQQKLALEIGNNIDRFNDGLRKLSNYVSNSATYDFPLL